MNIMWELLDAFKLKSTREMEDTKEITVAESQEEPSVDPYNKYYDYIAKQRENNINITYEDIECYDLKPFDLKKPILSDGKFTAIALEGENLEKAHGYLQKINKILNPFKHLYENVEFPREIETDYWIWNQNDHLPVSHLRLTPYTATMKKSKYPFWLFLSNYGDYGVEYIYMIYFSRNGEIGKCNLSLHGSNGARFSYESKLRSNENGLYVRRINKTLYEEPYGTSAIYDHEYDNRYAKKKSEPKNEQMSKYDLERFAVMCNAYVVREERKEKG